MNLYLFDMGLPMIFPAMYLMILALGPIIFIEAYMLRRLGLSLERTVVSAAVANIASTAIGIPVTWFLLFGLQMVTGGTLGFHISPFWDTFLGVTWRAPWMMPGPPEKDWMVPVAGIVLLVPFFFASWLVENWVVRFTARNAMIAAGADPGGAGGRIKRAVRNANLITYSLLAAFLLIILAFKLSGTGPF